MRRVRLQFAGDAQPRAVEVSMVRGPDGERITVETGGLVLEAERIDGDARRGVLVIDGRLRPYYCFRRGDDGAVWIDGRVYPFEILARKSRSSGGAARVRDRLTADMPGTILKINVSAGDCFEADDPLIVMESMKMEMTLTVPHAGSVRDISCSVGQLVDAGAVLATLDPAPAAS